MLIGKVYGIEETLDEFEEIGKNDHLIQGNIVLSQEVVSAGQVMLDLRGLSNGIYFVQIAGLLFMGSGLVIEALSDKQKSDFKAQFPKQYCNVGLYRWVRCPNYFGFSKFFKRTYNVSDVAK